jgi:hypothetical protein
MLELAHDLRLSRPDKNGKNIQRSGDPQDRTFDKSRSTLDGITAASTYALTRKRRYPWVMHICDCRVIRSKSGLNACRRDAREDDK